MAGLSEEEFHRYQQVLLELKSTKYQLEDEKRQLLSKVHLLENNLAKKEDIINRSKKTREFEILYNENDSMRHKLFTQGDEFRIQSETLMKEYSSIVKENEKLTNQLEAYRGGYAEEPAAISEDDSSDVAKQEKTSDKSDYYRQEIRELCKSKQKLEEQTIALEKELSEIRDGHESISSELAKLKVVKSDLEAQNSNFKQSILSKETLHSKDLETMILKHQKTVEELEESMSIRMQQLHKEHDDIISKLKSAHGTDLIKLKDEMQSKIDTIISSNDSATATHLSEMESLKTIHEEEIRNLEAQHEHNLDDLRKTHTIEIEENQTALAEKDHEHDAHTASLEAEIVKFKQEIEDVKNGVKIQEKKNVSGLRDLKKQLIAEARRADELQRRLEEMTVDAASRQSLEELFRPPMSNRLMDDGGGSLRSWNASNSGIGTDTSVTVGASPGGNPMISPNGGTTSAAAMFGFTGEDVRLMIQRLTETQQENCVLKEKVAHLEESNSSYADDLRDKAAIIERYVSSSHINSLSPTRPSSVAVSSISTTSAGQNGVARDLERLSIAVKSRFGDLLKSDADITNKNVQKNLQRLLEETLTKNIHLEESLLMLTTELESTKRRLKELTE